MKVLRKVITTTKDWYNLYVFGDWHIGSADTREERIESAIKFLSKRKKDDTGVLLAGDLIENVLPGSKGTPFELSIPDPDKQIERAVEYIDQIPEIVLASVEGNHEARTRKRTGQFVGKSILERKFGSDAKSRYLGIQGIVELIFKTTSGKKLQEYIVYLTHGNGNSSSLSSKYSKIHALRDMAKADIYTQGHMHTKLGMCDFITENGKIKKRMFVCCGSYLVDPTYGQEFGFKPTDHGFSKLSLNTKNYNIIGYY